MSQTQIYTTPLNYCSGDHLDTLGVYIYLQPGPEAATPCRAQGSLQRQNTHSPPMSTDLTASWRVSLTGSALDGGSLGGESWILCCGCSMSQGGECQWAPRSRRENWHEAPHTHTHITCRVIGRARCGRGVSSVRVFHLSVVEGRLGLGGVFSLRSGLSFVHPARHRNTCAR